MSTPDGFEFIVFCDSGSPKHGSKRPHPVVQGFMYVQDGDGGFWTDFTRSKRRQREAPAPSWRAMVGDNPFDLDAHMGQQVQTRELFTLCCDKCRLSVDARGERLDVVLDMWAAAGLDRIGLRGLQESLKSTT